MTFKDKAKWFSFEMSFVLAQSYAYGCGYACAYVNVYVAHFAACFCSTFCHDPCAYAPASSENQALPLLIFIIKAKKPENIATRPSLSTHEP